MYKKVLPLFLTGILLAACVSVSVDSQTLTPVQANFVTSTLQPTVAGFVPATLTPTPEVTLAPTLAVTAPPNCKDSAVLLRDVTIPDHTQVKAGETFTKTWEFQNNGTCPWIGYAIQFDSGDQMNAPLSAPIPDTAPKSNVQVSVQLTAPSSNGAFTGYYTLTNSNGSDIFIGTEKTFWVKIVVGNEGIIAPTSSGANPTQSTNSIVVSCSYSQNAGYVSQTASLINAERTNAGLNKLAINPQLTSAAQAHAGDMACNNNISHTGSDGSSVYSRIAASGYISSYVEEIIYGGGGPQAAMTWWMSDQIHREAILNPDVTEMGVGYAFYTNGSYGDYLVVNFASP